MRFIIKSIFCLHYFMSIKALRKKLIQNIFNFISLLEFIENIWFHSDHNYLIECLPNNYFYTI